MAGEENASLSSPVELCTGLRKGAACYKQDALETESKRGCRFEEGSQRGAFDTVQIYGRSYGARLYYYYYYYSKQEDLRHAITINYARTRLKAGCPPSSKAADSRRLRAFKAERRMVYRGGRRYYGYL